MDGVILPAPTKKTVTIAPLPVVETAKVDADCVDSGTCEDVVSASETSCDVDSHDDTSSDRTTTTTDSSHSSVTKTNESEVQAFLEDGDNVLDTLERCQAEDKCLMLIKRPKESARKMLKSHSLTQMSVSDPQLYRQFNGMQLTQVHQHAQTVSPTHQDEQLETQSTTSNSTEGTEPRRRYATVKDRLLKQPLPQYSGARRPPDYYRSDPCSNSNDVYQYLPRRGDHRDPCRRDLRYSSIPEDEDQEINNNHQHKGGSSSPDSMSPCHNNRGHFVRHDQSPNHTPSNRHNQRQSQSRCPPTYEQLQNGHALSSQNERSSQVLSAHDSSGDTGAGVDTRTQSGTSQPPGLTTFSLVGQRKAAGVTFSSPTAQRHQTNRQGPGEGDHYWDSPESADVAGRSHNRYMTNGLYPRASGHSPGNSKVSAPGCINGGSSDHHNGMPVSPSHHHRQHASNGDQHHRQYLPNGDVGESPRGSHQYSNGHAYSHGSSAPLQGHSQKVMSPLRIRTNMPPAPASVSESSERLKRFTEVMRCRTSVSSCGDMSTTSSMSHTPTTPHTPPSRQSSTTDNGWDSEVSTLLEVRLGDTDSSPSHKRASDTREKVVPGKQGCESGKDGHLNCPGKTANSSSSQETPNLCDQHSDGGQTSFTSHSHSSTMDSGYTTNTEGEGDSSLNHLSPPYHPSFPHHHHPVHTPHVQPEPYRPVPMPRNLFPTSARKCNSLHGSSSSTQHSPGHSAHPEGKNRVKSSPPSSSSQQKRAVSQCIQINGHPVDQVVHAQRSGGWNSAPSFKSLDYAPAGGVQVDTAGSSGDDLVIKPQVVARSGGSCVDSPASPSRVHDADTKPDTPNAAAGGEAGSSSTDQTAPSSLPPPPPPESNSVITVPGQWNHHNTNNNGNVVNNNNAAASANGVMFPSSPRSQPRPPVKATPIPTLFQVSQSHDLCSARLVTPGSLCASSLLTLSSVQVTFPSLNAENGSASQSPQGHCARIGGPGSAFRPVRAGSTSQTTDLTAVEAVDDQCRQYVTVGELQSGDLLLEVNGWQCMGQDTAGIQSLLDTTQDVTLVVARKRQETQRSNNNRVEELENCVQKLEEEVGRLSEDLSQKDARIQELSSLLPWTQDQQTGETALILQSEDDAFVIGENEFVV